MSCSFPTITVRSTLQTLFFSIDHLCDFFYLSITFKAIVADSFVVHTALGISSIYSLLWIFYRTSTTYTLSTTPLCCFLGISGLTSKYRKCDFSLNQSSLQMLQFQHQHRLFQTILIFQSKHQLLREFLSDQLRRYLYLHV